MRINLMRSVRGALVWENEFQRNLYIPCFSVSSIQYVSRGHVLESAIYSFPGLKSISYSPLHRRSAVFSYGQYGALIGKGVGEMTPLCPGWSPHLPEHGVFPAIDALRERDITAIFGNIFDAPTPVAVVELNQIYDEKGICVPADITNTPASLYFYLVKEPVRICDLPFLDEEFRIAVFRRSVAILLGESIEADQGKNLIEVYMLAFIKKLACASARLHLQGGHNAGIWEHNITMAGEILDFEQAHHPSVRDIHKYYSEDIEKHQKDEVVRSINAINYINGLLNYPIPEANAAHIYVREYIRINPYGELPNKIMSSWRRSICQASQFPS